MNNAEYLKIRYYVINLIQQAGTKQIKLPSFTELSDHFNVSRPTVNKALKDLIADGFIVSHKGLGTFSNPASLPFWLKPDKKIPIIGLLIHDGMVFVYDEYFGLMVSSLIRELVLMPAYVRMVNLMTNDSEQIKKELEQGAYDALVWHGACASEDVVNYLRESGKPVVVSGMTFDGPFNIRMDQDVLGYRCARQLLAEGRRKIVFLPSDEPWGRPIEGIRQAFNEAGLVPDEQLFLHGQVDCITNLRERLNSGFIPDAIFAEAETYEFVIKLLQEFRIDTQTQCRVIRRVIKEDKFTQDITYSCPYEKHAQNMVKVLKRCLAGELMAPLEERITEIDLFLGNNPNDGGL